MFVLVLAFEARAGGDHDHDHKQKHDEHSHDHEHGHDNDDGHKHGHKGKKRHHGAHVHGIGELKIVVVDKDIQIAMTIPGADIVGYEHAAKSDKDKAKAAEAKKLLSDAELLYSIESSAECKHKASGNAVSVSKKAHADWSTTHTFTCAKRPSFVELSIFDIKLPSEKAADLNLNYEIAVTGGEPVAQSIGKLSKDQRRVSLR